MITRPGLLALVVPTVVLVAVAAGGWCGARPDTPGDAARLPITRTARLTRLAQALEGATPDPMRQGPWRSTRAGLDELLGDVGPGRGRAGYEIAPRAIPDLLDRGGTPVMRQLMTRPGRGEPITAATSAVYGLPLAEFEHQWRRVLGG